MTHRAALVLTLSCTLFAVSAAFAGAPLKGVDVKLGRNPGGTAAMRTVTTDANGVLKLGVLERGSWKLVFDDTASQKAAAASDASARSLKVELQGTALGQQTFTYDRKSGSIVLHDRTETAKAAGNDGSHPKAQNANAGNDGSHPQPLPRTIVFESDGTHEVTATIVKSKSNISNN